MIEVKYSNKKKIAYELKVEEVPTLSQLIYEDKISFEAFDNIPSRYSFLVAYSSPISQRHLQPKFDANDLHCFGEEYKEMFMQKKPRVDLGMGMWFPFDSPDIYRAYIFNDMDINYKSWIVFAVRSNEQ